MNPAVVLSVAFATMVIGLVDGIDISTCPAKSPDFNNCLKRVLQEIVPSLAKGIPSIGAKAIDPLEGLPDFQFQRANGLVPFGVHTENNVVKGLTSVHVDDVQADLNANIFRIKSSVSGALEASGIHHTEGDVLGIKLRGNGPYKVTFGRAALDLTLQGHTTQGADGKTYLKIDSAKVGLETDTANSEIEGFFPNIPPLEKAATAFVNYFTGQVVDELQPTLEKWLEVIALKRAQAVFSTVPYDDLFPGRSSVL